MKPEYYFEDSAQNYSYLYRIKNKLNSFALRSRLIQWQWETTYLPGVGEVVGHEWESIHQRSQGVKVFFVKHTRGITEVGIIIVELLGKSK